MPRKFRQEKALFAECCVLAPCKEVLDMPFVFFFVQGTGRVEKEAASLQFAPRIPKDGGLKPFRFIQLFRGQAYAEFRGSPERARAAAGNIKKDKRIGAVQAGRGAPRRSSIHSGGTEPDRWPA